MYNVWYDIRFMKGHQFKYDKWKFTKFVKKKKNPEIQSVTNIKKTPGRIWFGTFQISSI